MEKRLLYNLINKEDMIPQKCIDRNCPRKGIDGKGTDVCILYQENEKKKLAVLDVFNVSEKQCKQLRASAKENMRKQAERWFGEVKEMVVKPIEGERSEE